MKTHTIQLDDKTYAYLEEHRKNKKQREYIFDCMTKHTKLSLENAKLKKQIPKELSPKEAFLKRVEAEDKLPLSLLDFKVPCHYRAVTSKGDLYCDDKKMAKEVCIQRQKRHLAMKRMCMPSALKKQRKGKATFSPNLWQPKSGDKGATKLWRG